MLVTGYWAEPFLDRERTRMFSPTLDSMIDKDDPVRLVDEVLAEIDWSTWEAEYNGHPSIGRTREDRTAIVRRVSRRSYARPLSQVTLQLERQLAVAG